MKTRLMVLFAASVLSACGQGGSTPHGGASGGQGLDARVVSSLGRSHDATTSAEQGITIDMPAFALVMEAVRRQTGNQGFIGRVACQNLDEATVWADDALTPPRPEPEQVTEVAAVEHADSPQRDSETPGETEEAGPTDMPPALRAELKPLVMGIVDVTRNALSDEAWDRAIVCGAYKIVHTSRPLSGWPVNAMKVTDELIEYIHDTLATAIAANTVLTPLVAELASHPHGSTEALIAEFEAAFAQQGIAFMREYYKQRRLNGGRQFSRDLTGSGPSPVHFTTGDGWDYQQGPNGVLLTYNGVEWYGKGHFSGTRYTLQTSHRRGTRMARSQDMRDEQVTTTRVGVEAGASLPQ